MIVFILIGVGLVCFGIFYVGIKEFLDDLLVERKLFYLIVVYVVNFGYIRVIVKRNFVFFISLIYSFL